MKLLHGKILTSTSSNINKKRMNYDLRMYTNSKKNIENISNNLLISYALYIEKYNIIGIVIENSSKIDFYNADTLKRVKAFIDVKKTQIDIDQIELKKFDIRAKEKIEHPENYIDIDNTINYLDNFCKELNSNNDYVLSLLGKSVETNGIEMNISKKKMKISKKLN